MRDIQTITLRIKMGRFTKRKNKMHGTKKNETKGKQERIAIALKVSLALNLNFE